MAAGETICAVATPPGKGAIAIVRISGAQSHALGQRLFRARGELEERRATYGTVVDERGAPIDRGLAIFCRAPRSYTGEDTLELHVHGSPAVAREVVRALLACGARMAEPGEFTRRAFFAGKLDLASVGAVGDLIDAETRSAARAAAANLGGGVADAVRSDRARLATALEELSAAIDFPDEVPDPDRRTLLRTIGELLGSLHELQRVGEAARIVREGVGVAIVGPPNAGKSSLLNALLGQERVLVSETAGTTRDTIEESIAIAGVQVRLTDTAGIREHADRLEAAGIERSRRALDRSRVALLVLDGSKPLDATAHALLEKTRERPRVVFANKADLGVTAEARTAATVCGSTRDPYALDELRASIASVGWGGDLPDLERPHLAALYELDAAARAADALARAEATLAGGEPIDLCAPELERAFAALGQVTGDEASEELLSGIFARFCIGK